MIDGHVQPGCRLLHVLAVIQLFAELFCHYSGAGDDSRLVANDGDHSALRDRFHGWREEA